MTADFLLELLSEEMPARMQAKARNDLARMMAEALAAAGLTHDGITTYSTPRRLALIARGLPLETGGGVGGTQGPQDRRAATGARRLPAQDRADTGTSLRIATASGSR